MPRGIIIFGSAGAGKTTLGRLCAGEPGFPYYDIDDYIWRQDTPQPYTVMYSRDEKARRLMDAISKGEHFVMAGSMGSFNAPFVPLFDIAVHLTADKALRLQRLHARELNAFGSRILPGGDMYEGHCSFLASAGGYDEGSGSPSLQSHLDWAATLPCPVLSLDGADTLDKNIRAITAAYRQAVAD